MVPQAPQLVAQQPTIDAAEGVFSFRRFLWSVLLGNVDSSSNVADVHLAAGGLGDGEIAFHVVYADASPAVAQTSKGSESGSPAVKLR